MKEDERSEERTEGEREEEKGERERESIGDIYKILQIIGESQVKMACLCFFPRYRARCEYLVKCNVNNC